MLPTFGNWSCFQFAGQVEINPVSPCQTFLDIFFFFFHSKNQFQLLIKFSRTTSNGMALKLFCPIISALSQPVLLSSNEKLSLRMQTLLELKAVTDCRPVWSIFDVKSLKK
jgi:hypothetical protein